MKMNISNVRPDMEVNAKTSGQTGESTCDCIGTVDHMDGERYIKLKKSDSPDGKHHWIPIDWVDKIENNQIYLNKTEQEVQIEKFDSYPGVDHEEQRAS